MENDTKLVVDVLHYPFSNAQNKLNEENVRGNRLWLMFSLVTLLPFLSEEKGRMSMALELGDLDSRLCVVDNNQLCGLKQVT